MVTRQPRRRKNPPARMQRFVVPVALGAKVTLVLVVDLSRFPFILHSGCLLHAFIIEVFVSSCCDGFVTRALQSSACCLHPFAACILHPGVLCWWGCQARPRFRKIPRVVAAADGIWRGSGLRSARDHPMKGVWVTGGKLPQLVYVWALPGWGVAAFVSCGGFDKCNYRNTGLSSQGGHSTHTQKYEHPPTSVSLSLALVWVPPTQKIDPKTSLEFDMGVGEGVRCGQEFGRAPYLLPGSRRRRGGGRELGRPPSYNLAWVVVDGR